MRGERIYIMRQEVCTFRIFVIKAGLYGMESLKFGDYENGQTMLIQKQFDRTDEKASSHGDAFFCELI